MGQSWRWRGRAATVQIAGAGIALLLGGACAEKAAGPAPAAKPAAKQASSAGAAAAASPDPLAVDGTVAIRSGCGYRLVVNNRDAHFTIDLIGTSLRTKESDHLLFLVDDLIVQVVNVTREQIGAAAAGKSGYDLMRAHAAWESAFIAKQLGVAAAPQELGLVPRAGKAPVGAGLIWWMPAGAHEPDDKGALKPVWVFTTAELGNQIVGLSAIAQQGLEPRDVMDRLAIWMSTLAPSPTPLSPRAVSADVRRAADGEEHCHEPVSRGIHGIDRRLRFDQIPRSEWQPLIDIAESSGGVERQTVDGRRRYRNHICRFEVTYPDADWIDFAVQDVSDRGCAANLSTPLVVDRDTKEKIANAVLLMAAPANADFGSAQLQQAMVDAVKAKAARVQPASKPMLDGALDVTYTTDVEGTHFVGEIATVRRGEMLYNIHFNATRGTIAEGRKHLQKLLATLRLDVP